MLFDVSNRNQAHRMARQNQLHALEWVIIETQQKEDTVQITKELMVIEGHDIYC
jgi:hypothetical protein